MVQTCPTCGGNTEGSPWAEVKHSFNDAANGGRWAISRVGLNPVALTQVKFQGSGEVIPRPLLLKGRALRTGVGVATWRHSRGLTPQHFAPNDFGVFAVAVAQVGIRDPQSNVVAVPQTVTDQRATYVFSSGNQRTVALNANANNQGIDNFYLGSGEQGDPGFRFGARLVPVARELSWVEEPGGAARKGLEDLFDRPRWYNTVPSGAVPQNGQAPSGDLAAAIGKLKQFMDIRSARSFAQ
jgi:hypothetical protein